MSEEQTVTKELQRIADSLESIQKILEDKLEPKFQTEKIADEIEKRLIRKDVSL